MPVKKRSKSSGPKKSGKSGKKRSRSSSPGKGGGKAKLKDDYMNPIALNHAYYLTHAVPDSLDAFGIKWDGAKKKKKKKK